MPLLIAIVAGDLAQVFASSTVTSSAGRFGRIDTSGRGGIFPSLILIVLLLLLLPKLLVGGLGILGARGM